MSADDDRLYNLEVGVEVSTLYHEWRRATFEFWALLIRACALMGSVVALVSVFAFTGDAVIQLAVALASAFVALVTLADLVLGVDRKSRVHADLYQRFKRLQVSIARQRDDWQAHVAEWNAEAQTIRIDEPPVLWAIYMGAWNQALRKRKVSPTQLRRVTRWQATWGRFYPYRPQDFPLVGA
jgi:hypothetical protein